MIALDDNFDEHPKFIELSNDATALWIRCLGYCRRNLTDGFVPESVAISSSRAAKKAKQRSIIDELCAPPKAAPHLAPLWKRVPGGYEYHDYLRGGWNPSKAEVEAKREQRRAAGSLGGRVSSASRTPRGSSKTQAGASSTPGESLEVVAQPHADPIRSDPSRAVEHGGDVRSGLVRNLTRHAITAPLATSAPVLDLLEARARQEGLPAPYVASAVDWAVSRLQADIAIGESPTPAQVIHKLQSGIAGEVTKLGRGGSEPEAQRPPSGIAAGTVLHLPPPPRRPSRYDPPSGGGQAAS